jgi:hypothetical protein
MMAKVLTFDDEFRPRGVDTGVVELDMFVRVLNQPATVRAVEGAGDLTETERHAHAKTVAIKTLLDLAAKGVEGADVVVARPGAAIAAEMTHAMALDEAGVQELTVAQALSLED